MKIIKVFNSMKIGFLFLFMLFFSNNLLAQGGVDVIVWLDNSGSINATEYAAMEAITKDIISQTINCDPSKNKVAVVHYGQAVLSDGSRPNRIFIESDFTNNTTTANSFQRRGTSTIPTPANDVGRNDEAHAGLGFIGNALDGVTNAGIISTQKILTRTPGNRLVIFFFTDASRNSSLFSSLINQNPGDIFLNYNNFKANRNAHSVVLKGLGGGNATDEAAANRAAAAIASVGGNFTTTASIEANSNDPEGSQTTPRAYYYTPNFSIPSADLTSIVGEICAANPCAAGTVAPLINATGQYSDVNFTYTIPCGSLTANLSTLTESNTPGGSSITWHTGAIATDTNKVTATAIAGTSKLYAAFFDAALSCYSPTREITISAPICAANDDYSSTPIIAGVGGTLPSIFNNDTYNGNNIALLPPNSVQFLYELWVPANAIVDVAGNGSLTIPASVPPGTYTYLYKICDNDQDAVPGSSCGIATVTFVVDIDSDGDGVVNSIDLDDDNDGILDTNECGATNRIVRGDFFNLPSPSGNLTAAQIATATSNKWTFVTTNSATINWSNITVPAYGNGIRFQNDGETQSLTQALTNINYPGTETAPQLNIGRFRANNGQGGTGSGLQLGRSSTFTISYAGVEYARIVTENGMNTNAALTYSNGATGNLTSILVDTIYPTWTVTLPTSVPQNGNLTIGFVGGAGSSVGASDDFAFDNLSINVCKDTDGDGIQDYLDLDSDGDGCSDAIEGGAAFIASNLVISAMAGGNSGAGYNGLSSASVTQNLGNTVGSTPTTIGVPTIAGTGQADGQSQNGFKNDCQDADLDGIGDWEDLDDDNDGILDTAECTTTVNDFITAFGAATTTDIFPSDFGLALNVKNQNVTADLSAKFGYPANSGAVIVNITNASVHPTSNVLWTKNGEQPSIWKVTGTMTAFLGMAHDLLYYANDSKTFHIYDNADLIPVTAPGFVNQTAVAGQWSIIDTQSQKTLNNLNTDGGTTENANWRYINMNFGPKSFGFSTTVASGNPNYGVTMLLECDTDKDGIPNRLDLDSDGDGCSDAIEEVLLLLLLIW